MLRRGLVLDLSIAFGKTSIYKDAIPPLRSCTPWLIQMNNTQTCQHFILIVLIQVSELLLAISTGTVCERRHSAIFSSTNILSRKATYAYMT